MAHIPASELPQPFYPQATVVPPAPHAAYPTSPITATPSPTPAAPARPVPPLVWVVGGAAVLVVALVATLVIVLGGPGTAPPSTAPASATESGNGGSEAVNVSESDTTSVEVNAAVNTLVAGVTVPDSERECLTESLLDDPAMVAAINTESSDPAELATLIVDCISADSLADAVLQDMAESGVVLTASQESCIVTAIGTTPTIGLEDLVRIGLEGTHDELVEAHAAIWGYCITQ